jgi:hypothetical protein
VSPPWCAETHLQGRYRKRAGDCRRCAGERRCNRGRRASVGSVPSNRAVALRTRFGEPREADACPALVSHECASAGDFRLPLHARYPTTGGLRPPLLVVHAFVHRKSRHFTGRDSCIQTGAAGVSPPWVAETHLQGRYRKRAGDCRRWAGERYCNRGRRESVGCLPSDCAVTLRMRFRESRGLTPPAFVLHESASAGDLRFPLHARYPTTGGLRPPLLVVHAFVHRKSRHFTGKRSRLQTGAAGVSPPWVRQTYA